MKELEEWNYPRFTQRTVAQQFKSSAGQQFALERNLSLLIPDYIYYVKFHPFFIYQFPRLSSFVHMKFCNG